MTCTTFVASNAECRIGTTDTDAASERTARRAFLGISASLFAITAVLTAVWCASMAAMPEMHMPGGWTMSMTWMAMPGQTWMEAAASFIAVWVVMMAAMMLPSQAPVLWRYGQAISRRGEARVGSVTLHAGLGYFFVWTLFGFIVFPLGVVLATIEMQQPTLARAVPVTAGVVILIAGAVQLTSWKAHHLTRCRETPARGSSLPADARTAWRQGMRFGLDCTLSCANLMTILMVIGVMDLRAMAAVTAAITAERLAPAGERVAHATGVVVMVTGILQIARATRLG